MLLLLISHRHCETCMMSMLWRLSALQIIVHWRSISALRGASDPCIHFAFYVLDTNCDVYPDHHHDDPALLCHYWWWWCRACSRVGRYDHATSDRLGRSKSKEQYSFIYKWAVTEFRPLSLVSVLIMLSPPRKGRHVAHIDLPLVLGDTSNVMPRYVSWKVSRYSMLSRYLIVRTINLISCFCYCRLCCVSAITHANIASIRAGPMSELLVRDIKFYEILSSWKFQWQTSGQF